MISLRIKNGELSGVAYCQQTKGDILVAQDRIPEAKSSYGSAEQIYLQIRKPGDAAGVWIAQAKLNNESGNPAEGETIARKAALEFAKEKDADMQSSALGELLHSLVKQGKRAESEQTWNNLAQLHPSDSDTQQEVNTAEARYRMFLGSLDVALAKIGQVRTFCKQHGRINCELEARLLTAQIHALAKQPAGLDLELRDLAAEASRFGFSLIADQAGKALSPSKAEPIQR